MSKALPIATAILLGGVALTPVFYAVQNPTDPVAKGAKAAQLDEKSSNLQKLSYALGYSIGQQVLPDADMSAVMAGTQDAKEGKAPRYSEEELKAAVEGYMKESFEAAQAAQAQQTQATPTQQALQTPTAEAQAFFAENVKKEGVKTTASGLQYKIIKEGTGATPTASSKVTVHYEGRLINGSVFDSSAKHGGPITFELNKVIPGWTEGLALMKEGTKAQLYIPAELAYGSHEQPGIPANSPLIFDVELVKVE